MSSETKNARTMVDILQDRIEKMETELEKASEILEMLVGVVSSIYKGEVVESGPLTVELEDGTGTAYDSSFPEDNDPED